MSSASASYGLPTRGSVGVSVGGQDIFPLFNNRAEVCTCDGCSGSLL